MSAPSTPPNANRTRGARSTGGAPRRASRTLLLLVLVAAPCCGRAEGPAPAPAPAAVAEGPTWVWHYTAADAPIRDPVYRQLLAEAPAGTRVVVAAPDEALARVAESVLRPATPDDVSLDVLSIGAPLGGWARDPYLFFDRDGARFALLPPAQNLTAETRGDIEVPDALQALAPDLTVVRRSYVIEGGDVILTSSRAFLGVTTLLKNVGHADDRADALVKDIETTLGREVLVVGRALGAAPYPHLDMFLTPLGERTVALGDPSLASSAFRGADGREQDEVSFGDLGRFRQDTQVRMKALYASIENQLLDAGYRVYRLPILHGEPRGDRPGVLLNWNNVLIQTADGACDVFLPRYGIPELDELAADLWRSWGYRVHPVHMRATVEVGGDVRCLTNVLLPAGAPPFCP